jgi:GH25 family lysozyme M1 (1,4-beta-N-acetylmuramidase)
MIRKASVKLTAILVSLAVAALTTSLPVAYAVTSKLTLTVKQTPNLVESLLTFYGTLTPKKSGLSVKIQSEIDGKWTDTRFTSKTTKLGTWKLEAVVTAQDSVIKYRAKTIVGTKTIYSSSKTITVKPAAQITELEPALAVEALGPGGRIHGVDISRWQHPNDARIDFAKMYAAGIRFAMIKASDTRDDADALSLKYLLIDRPAAQAAGIYTGFYHYTILPNTSDPAAIIRDATAQAQKVIWRISAIGGLTARDLPYALDLENNCVKLNSNGSCATYATKSSVTLWAETFLALLTEKLGRKPIFYSYPSFLEGAMNKSAELSKYPLWLAQYAINPFDPINQPGIKPGGCYVHSWTSSACQSQWIIWQYSSCGISTKYGVPSSRVDLNVFRGTAQNFLDLTAGTWVPEPIDLMPVNEATTMLISKQKATDTSKAVSFSVGVNRPDGSPVVTGTVRFIYDPLSIDKPKLAQTVTRAASGLWTLSIKGFNAGSWVGSIVFTDQTNTHATTQLPVVFDLLQGETPTPTPTPSKSNTPKPVTDGCKNQIKN